MLPSMPTPAPSEPHHPKSGPAQVFISFAPEDAALLNELMDHLAHLQREGLINLWHRGMVAPGESLAATAAARMEDAEVVIVLLSAALMARDSGHAEVTRALERQRAREVRMVPVLARPLDLSAAPLAGLQVLPRGGQAVSSWADHHAAWIQVAGEIKDLSGEVASCPSPRSVALIPRVVREVVAVQQQDLSTEVKLICNGLTRRPLNLSVKVHWPGLIVTAIIVLVLILVYLQ